MRCFLGLLAIFLPLASPALGLSDKQPAAADSSLSLQLVQNHFEGKPAWHNGRYQFGFVGSFALYGLIADDSRALKTASQMTEAILATGIVVQVLKRIAGRESPIVATQGRGAVRPFPNLADYQRHQPKYYSFPSGHIATTTAALTVLCEDFPEAKWMRPMSYILIGAVGGSLVSKGWHWYSDLPFGIALGYSFGVIAAHPEGLDIKKSNNDTSLDVSVVPKLISSGAELEMTVHF